MMMVDQFFFVCGYWLAYFANQFFLCVFNCYLFQSKLVLQQFQL